MIAYADTSWWLAYKCSDDANHARAIRMLESLDDDAVVIWTPWQRVEVFNAFRQAERTGIIAQGKARELIRALEMEIRLGYWLHVEFDWRDAVRTACELSAEHSLQTPVRGMDLFHVAVAIESASVLFMTFDREQLAFAKKAGIQPLSSR
ncbi:MAG: type II toxin-antitoxin system VapC family toxin [Chthoniobacteraceae bacterium]